MTWPVLRSISTRAFGLAPGVLWYGDQQRRLDRLDEDVEGDLLLALERAQHRQVDVHQLALLPGELDLDRAFATSAYATGGSVPSTSSTALVLVAPRDAAGDLAAVGAWYLDQPADVAAPVARQRERPVDARGGDLERVGLLAHRVGGVERRETSRVASAMSSRLTPPSLSTATRSSRRLPGGRELDGLEVEARSVERRRQHTGKAVPSLVVCHGASCLCCCRRR